MVNSSSVASGPVTVSPFASVTVTFGLGGAGRSGRWIEHALDQRQSSIASGDAGQVAGCGMARGTAACAVEIALAGGGVSGEEKLGIDGAASSAERFGLGFLVVDEGDDGVHIRVAQIGEWLHGAAPGPDQWGDLIAAQVLGDQLGASQIGPSLAAGSVAAVTKAALCAEALLAGLNLFGGISLRRHRLRSGL